MFYNNNKHIFGDHPSARALCVAVTTAIFLCCCDNRKHSTTTILSTPVPKLEFRIVLDVNDIEKYKGTSFFNEFKNKSSPTFLSKPYAWFEIKSLPQYLGILHEDNWKRLSEEKRHFFCAKLNIDAKSATSAKVIQAIEMALDSSKNQADGAYIGQEKIEAIMLDRGVVSKVYNGKVYMLIGNDELGNNNALAGGRDWSVVSCKISYNQYGDTSVLLKIDTKGAALLEKMTMANLQKKMAILLNGQVLATPIIQGKVSEDVMIPGDYTQAEAVSLSNEIDVLYHLSR